MVWVYGGGFMGGGTNVPAYDPSLLANDQQVIVVSMNYRMGLFGFYSHKSMRKNATQRAVGNVGLLDQVLALKWVKQHIAEFGGDADNITLFGQSAGGVSACLHLASPMTKGLFHKVIMQSGSCGYPTVSQREAFVHGERLAKLLGCEEGGLACLRRYSIKELKKKIIESKVDTSIYSSVHQRALPRVAVVDDYYLSSYPLDTLVKSDVPEIPVLLDFTKNEGSIFLTSNRLTIPKTEAEYQMYLKNEVGESWQEVYEHYPVEKDAVKAMADFVGDRSLSCGVIKTADSLNKNNRAVYAYEFDLDANDALFKLYLALISGKYLGDIGSFHSIDVAYVFGKSPVIKLADEDKKVSRRIREMWGSFATSGVPSYSDSNDQPAALVKYDRSSQKVNVVSRKVVTGDWQVKRKKCDVIERVAPLTFSYEIE